MWKGIKPTLGEGSQLVLTAIGMRAITQTFFCVINNVQIIDNDTVTSKTNKGAVVKGLFDGEIWCKRSR